MDDNCSESVEIQRTPEISRNDGKQRGPENKMKLCLDHISCILAHGRQGFHPGFPPHLVNPGNGFTKDLTTASLAKSGSI